MLSSYLRFRSVANHITQFFARLMIVHRSDGMVVGGIDHRFSSYDGKIPQIRSRVIRWQAE